MEKRHKAECAAVMLATAELISLTAKIGNGGYRMVEGFTVAEVISYVVDVGLTPVLLILFIIFFIRRASDDDVRVKQAYADAQSKIEHCNQEVRERENMLLAESAKREEILRHEAEKRENLIRKEAEKRESILMNNQERMMNTMDQISRSMQKMENSLGKMESRHELDIKRLHDQMHSLEQKIDNIGGKGS